MSNKWLALLKIQLHSILLSGQMINSQKKKIRILWTLCMYGFLGLVLAFYCGMLTYAYIIAGMGALVMPLIMTISALFILVTTIFKANGYLFAAKDDELLMSLPVPSSHIIVSRFITLYIFEMFETLAIMLPSMIVYEALSGFSLGRFICGIIGSFFVPMFPLAVASLIGILVSYISMRFRHKNIVSIVVSIVFLVGIMALTSTAGNVTESQMLDLGKAIGDMIGRLYPPSILFAQGMNGNMLALIGFILLSVIAAAAVIALIAVKYKKICTMIMAEQSKGNYKMTSLKTSSRMWALVMKEFKMYISYPTWVLNTSVGYILNIAAGIAVFFMKDIEQMLNIPMIPELVSIFIPILLSFFMALTSVTYPSISLEGKNMWLLLHLPIESKHIYKAKILMSLCLAVPSSLIASALFILRFRPSVFYTVMAVVIPLFYSLCAAVMGLAVNLKFPNFSWTNATAVVKNSLSATICIFGGMFMVIIPGVLLVIFMDYAAIIYSVLAVILLVLTIIFYRSIMKVNLVRLTEEN